MESAKATVPPWGSGALKLVESCVVANVGSVERWTLKVMALSDASRQERLTAAPPGAAEAVAARVAGASGAVTKTSARSMSFSSWPSRWQCHTYSHPKFWITLATLMGLLVMSTPVNWVPVPSGSVTSSGRHMSGSGHGRLDIFTGFIAT